ncbi:hypothetical protein [Oceanicella sp. SM1341]|uniref:hypothetical protein n=1 Tax=Oceanicella sp. SM1341 TaxID=1548889 RepID=UPI000E5193CE|nr:hypothetical protein [Oceanicella sp. SM1341]
MTNPTTPDHPDLLAPLVACYRELTEYSFPTVLAVRPDLVDQIRDLGTRLCMRGGMAAMADASVHVHRETGDRHATGYHFNRLWDGIGPWRA